MTANKIKATIRINKEIYSILTEKAKSMGISVNAYISMILAKECIEQK